MVNLFSSPEATAVANLLVFTGIIWAAVRIGRNWSNRIAAKFSVASRKAQQKQILGELEKIRFYRRNKVAAISDAAYGIFDDIIGSLTVIGLALCGLFIMMSIDHESDRDGPDAKIWESIYGDHTYWFSVNTIAFVGSTAFFLLMLWGSRNQLRFLKYASQPEENRTKLIGRYLKLRSLR